MSCSVVTRAERATLKEIARVAGVSVSTASVVLNGKGTQRRISPEVQARVRLVAAERDYHPNLLVRSLQQGRTHVLSLYNAFGLHQYDNLYNNLLSAAVQNAVGAARYDLLVHCDFHRPADETYSMLNGGRSDGVLFFGPSPEHPLLQQLRGSRLPTVILSRADREGVLSSVTDDVRSGMKQVADALTELGHRRVAVIAGPPNRESSLVRVALLRERLAAYGCPLPEERVLPVYDGGPLGTEEAVRALMQQPEPPTALFCWHDRLGYQVLDACQALGIDVPGRLSVVGYDGLHWPSASGQRLASVDVDLQGLTAAGVRLLDGLIQGEIAAPTALIHPVSLIRGTTLAPPDGGPQ